MTFDEYQSKAITTAVFKRGDFNAFMARTLGLVGEAGEVAEKVKKIVRDKGGVYDTNDVKELKKELGDVLWYIASMADYFELSLEDIAQDNISKLADRKKRGKVKGSGDNR